MAGRTWWTSERRGVVAQMAAQGHTTASIAAALARHEGEPITARAVRHACAYYGIALRRGRGDAPWRPKPPQPITRAPRSS